MNGAAKVKFGLENRTSIVPGVSSGIVFVQGTSLRGPYSDPSEIITSWPRFVEKFGGLTPHSDTPYLCKRLLDKGAIIRFSRVGKYTEGVLEAKESEMGYQFKVDFNSPLVAENVITINFGGEEIVVNYLMDNLTTLKKLATEAKKLPNVRQVNYMMRGNKPSLYLHVGMEYSEGGNPTATVIGGASQSTTTVENVRGIMDNTDVVVKPKYPGADGDNIIVTIAKSKGNRPGSYDIEVRHRTEPMLTETYRNILTGNVKSFTQDINSMSNLIKIEVNSPNPDWDGINEGVYTFESGTDGGTPQLSDYVGTSELMNGLHAFDEYNDSYYLATFDDVDIDYQGVEYCRQRDDMAYMIHLEGKTKQNLIEEKNTKGIDDKHSYFVGGGLKIVDPFTGEPRDISELADVLATATSSDRNYGPWYSFAGPNRGIIGNVIGVASNFGTPAKYRDLDELADNNINMVINRDGSTKLWGNFSGQTLNNQERYFNVVKLVFYIKRALRPILETFLEEPNDIPTWLRMYYAIRPIMDNLVDKRALYSYVWEGDQFASNMADLKINKAVDVTQGKYRAVLQLSAINSLQEITVGIVLTDAGIEFEMINN